MTEGPISGRPPRKGTRNAEISAQLLAEQLQEQMAQEEDLTAPVEEQVGGFSYLRTGRTITAKTSASHDVGSRGDYPWFTFGITETFDEDDDLEAIIQGLAQVTNAATLIMADDMAQRIAEIQEARNTAPITPRSAR